MNRDRKGLDRRRLWRGAVIAGVVSVGGSAAVAVHNVAFYDPEGAAEEGTTVLFTEILIFGVIALLGLLAATFYSVWRARGSLIAQGLTAIALDWAAMFLPALVVGAFLFGGAANVLQAMIPVAPVYLLLQLLTAAAAAGLTRLRPAERNEPRLG